MTTQFNNPMTFDEYIGLIDALLTEGKTTGEDQSPSRTTYAMLNRRRIARIIKTFTPDLAVSERLKAISRPQTWYVLTEGWCGDAAQSVPIIETLAGSSPSVVTRYLLRDENPELMDKYLTRGARSIPKVIAVENATGKHLWHWGPRPADAQGLYDELKASGTLKDEILLAMQTWYNSNKGVDTAAEIASLVQAAEEGVITRSVGSVVV